MMNIAPNMVYGPAGLVGFQMISQSPALALVAFNDPARANAMTRTMAQDFSAVVGGLKEAGPEAIVVTGTGRTFSAGGDMEMIRQKQSQPAKQNSSEMYDFYRSFLGILDLKVPVVAAINGAAIGAGLCFACACDRRIAAYIDGNILGFSFAKLGLTPGMGGTIFPRRLVGDEEADRMLAEAYNITPRRAFEIGMVEMVAPRKMLLDYAILAAMRLAAKPKAAFRKRLGWHELKLQLTEEARLQGASFLTGEHLRKYELFIRDLNGRRAIP